MTTGQLARTAERGGGTARPAQAPLRGRDDERLSIQRWVTTMSAGERAPVLIIEGAPGIGKSRLLDEVRSRATAAGLIVSSTACDPMERDRPFASVIRALGCDRRSADPARRAVADHCRELFGHPTDPVGESNLGHRFGIQDDLVELVVEAAESNAQILMIDDAQWLDPGAAATIAALARTAARRRIGLVVARRLHPCPLAVEELLVSLAGDTNVIELGPLTDDAVAAIAFDVAGHVPSHPLPPRLAQAGGSPFAVLAVLSSTWFDNGSDIPPSSGAALRVARTSTLARIRAHGESVERLLGWAAVLGIGFTPDQVSLLSRQPLADVLGCLALAADDGLLRAEGRAFQFSHGLVAEFVLESLALPLRLAMHREVARCASDLRLRPAVRAHHVSVAAEPGDAEAVAILIAAADEVARHDPEQALIHLERADQLSQALVAAQIEITLRRADALAGLCRVTEAIAVIDSGLCVAVDPGDIVRLRSARARCRHQIGDLVGASDERELLARSGALDSAHEAAAWADVATYRLWAMLGSRPQEEARRAIDLAERSGAVAPFVQAQAALGAMAAFDGHVADAVRHAELACQRAVALPPHLVVPSPAFTRGLVYLLADDIDGAVRTLSADRVRIERLGDPLVAARPATAALISLYLGGRWADALVEAHGLAQLAAETGLSIGRLSSQVVRGLIAHHRGEELEADDALTAALATAGSSQSGSEGYAVPFLIQLQAARAEAAGDLASAGKLLDDLAALSAVIAPAIGPWFALDSLRLTMVTRARKYRQPGAPESPRPVPGGPVRYGAAGEHGPLAGLEWLVEETGRLAARSERPVVHAVWNLANGLSTGEADALIEAVSCFRRSPLVLHRALGLELAAVGLLWAERSDEARSALAEAHALAHSLGATRDADRIGDLLHGRRARGQKRATRPTFGFASLTPAEISVLRRVVEGDRNRDIADALVISKRTVESHVSSMLMKLSVDTRVALARLGADHLGRS